MSTPARRRLMRDFKRWVIDRFEWKISWTNLEHFRWVKRNRISEYHHVYNWVIAISVPPNNKLLNLKTSLEPSRNDCLIWTFKCKNFFAVKWNLRWFINYCVSRRRFFNLFLFVMFQTGSWSIKLSMRIVNVVVSTSLSFDFRIQLGSHLAVRDSIKLDFPFRIKKLAQLDLTAQSSRRYCFINKVRECAWAQFTRSTVCFRRKWNENKKKRDEKFSSEWDLVFFRQSMTSLSFSWLHVLVKSVTVFFLFLFCWQTRDAQNDFVEPLASYSRPKASQKENLMIHEFCIFFVPSKFGWFVAHQLTAMFATRLQSTSKSSFTNLNFERNYIDNILSLVSNEDEPWVKEFSILRWRAVIHFKQFNVVMTTLTNIFFLFHFYRLQEDPPTGVSGAPTDNNIMIWNAVIFGPHDTPFEDGTFKLTIEFTEEYPNKPPTVRFVSKMFHPNVYADGGICLDILQNRWSPTYDVSAILTSIQVWTILKTLKTFEWLICSFLLVTSERSES